MGLLYTRVSNSAERAGALPPRGDGAALLYRSGNTSTIHRGDLTPKKRVCMPFESDLQYVHGHWREAFRIYNVIPPSSREAHP